MSDVDFELECRALRKQFVAMKLDSLLVSPHLNGEWERESKLLHDLMSWVIAYKRTPNSEQMEARGFEFPPVFPDMGPDTDWLLFENWINKRPTHFDLGESGEFFRLTDLDSATDDEVLAELEIIYKLLEKCSIEIHLAEDLPVKLEYEYLRNYFKDEKIQVFGGGMVWCIDGCSGSCPDCEQRPWCHNGLSKFSEDEEAGVMVVPERIKKYITHDLPSVDDLEDFC